MVPPVTIDATAIITAAALLYLLSAVADAKLVHGHVLRAMYAARAALLRRSIERRLGARLVLMIGEVSEDHSVAWARAVRATRGPLHILLHTDGGQSHARARVTRAVGGHDGPVIVHVPERAWSSGTAIALAGDTIRLGPDALLGPIDSTRQTPATIAFCAFEVIAAEQGITADLVRDWAALDECETDLRWSRQRRRERAGIETTGDPDAFLVEQIIRGGWGCHWRPIFSQDAEHLGIHAGPEDPKLHQRLAKLSRLAYLALPVAER